MVRPRRSKGLLRPMQEPGVAEDDPLPSPGPNKCNSALCWTTACGSIAFCCINSGTQAYHEGNKLRGGGGLGRLKLEGGSFGTTP